MLKFKYLLFLILYFPFSTPVCLAQKLVPYELTFHENGKSVLYTKDSITIESLRFYVSNFTFFDKNGNDYKDKNYIKLIEFYSDTTVNISIPLPSDFEPAFLTFDIGIDSNINKLGIQGGDLDPTRGMYWSWQSGYINFKIEGSSPKCNTRKNKFQYHIGGFLVNQYALQTVEIKNVAKKAVIIIDLPIIFKEIDIRKEPSIMIPGKRAIELSNSIKKMFRTTI